MTVCFCFWCEFICLFGREVEKKLDDRHMQKSHLLDFTEHIRGCITAVTA